MTHHSTAHPEGFLVVEPSGVHAKEGAWAVLCGLHLKTDGAEVATTFALGFYGDKEAAERRAESLAAGESYPIKAHTEEDIKLWERERRNR